MDAASPWPQGRLEGIEAFRGLVHNALAAAAAEGCQEMFWCDPNFADWPLGERAVVEHLNAWVRSGRRLRLLASDYRLLQAGQARFVSWRSLWSHRVEARATGRGPGGVIPSAMWTPGWSFERIDVEHNISLATLDRTARMQLLDRLEARWRVAAPSFSVTTLGL